MSVTYNDDGYPIYSGGEKYGELIDVEELNVTENGTYTAERGVAYSPVNVSVEGGGFEPVTTEFFADEVTTDDYEEWHTINIGAGDYQYPILCTAPSGEENSIYYPKMVAIIDDEEYVLEPIIFNYYETYYGGWDIQNETQDFTEYPFWIYVSVSMGNCNLSIGFENSGTYDVALLYRWDVNVCDVTIVNESSTGVLVNGYGAIKFENKIAEDTTIEFSIPYVNGGEIYITPDGGSIELSIEGEGTIDVDLGRVTFTSTEITITISDYGNE